jgi:hypothetical protein
VNEYAKLCPLNQKSIESWSVKSRVYCNILIRYATASFPKNDSAPFVSCKMWSNSCVRFELWRLAAGDYASDELVAFISDRRDRKQLGSSRRPQWGCETCRNSASGCTLTLFLANSIGAPWGSDIPLVNLSVVFQRSLNPVSGYRIVASYLQ